MRNTSKSMWKDLQACNQIKEYWNYFFLCRQRVKCFLILREKNKEKYTLLTGMLICTFLRKAMCQYVSEYKLYICFDSAILFTELHPKETIA